MSASSVIPAGRQSARKRSTLKWRRTATTMRTRCGSAPSRSPPRRITAAAIDRSVELQPDEPHRAIGVAAVDRFDRLRHEVEGVEPADAELEIGRDREFAEQADADLADAVGFAMVAAALVMARHQLVILGHLAAAEQYPVLPF